jgi:hypothetical protein
MSSMGYIRLDDLCAVSILFWFLCLVRSCSQATGILVMPSLLLHSDPGKITFFSKSKDVESNNKTLSGVF